MRNEVVFMPNHYVTNRFIEAHRTQAHTNRLEISHMKSYRIPSDRLGVGRSYYAPNRVIREIKHRPVRWWILYSMQNKHTIVSANVKMIRKTERGREWKTFFFFWKCSIARNMYSIHRYVKHLSCRGILAAMREKSLTTLGGTPPN